jgi:hypothetical protein
LLLAIGFANTLEQSDKQYRQFIDRMANKGLPEGKQHDSKEITDELKELVQSGYAENGGPRYRLTNEALELLVQNSKRNKMLALPIVSPLEWSSSPEEKVGQQPPSVGSYALRLVDKLEKRGERGYPSLPSERVAEEFFVGQKLILFYSGNLHIATVKKAKAYNADTNLTLGPEVELSDEAIAAGKEYAWQRVDELNREEQQIWSRTGFGPEAKPLFVGNGYNRFGPDRELLRRKMQLIPLFHHLVKNPSPGFVHLTFESSYAGLITDMHHNYIIPLEAWGAMLKDPDYLEAWLQSGSEESQRDSEELRGAIKNASINRVA